MNAIINASWLVDKRAFSYKCWSMSTHARTVVLIVALRIPQANPCPVLMKNGGPEILEDEDEDGEVLVVPFTAVTLGLSIHDQREGYTLTFASSPVSCIQVVWFANLRTKTRMYRVPGPNEIRSFALTRSRTRQDWERTVSRSLVGVPMEVASAGGSTIDPVGKLVCFQKPFVQKIQGNQNFCKVNRYPPLILGGRLLGNHRAAFQLEMTD
ncbi:hypothetical protein C8J55DRAFT_552097 [Lentinula edodes]|uniref:Uncharacterized protein n=1 Tax=Lentinula lateritia TaxID=40482 RepID=A0A9W9DFQ7_9AGAR|nr:hypothetical protein C8J55DRAFT_552097 [Lentinula edodes]